jgi:hypothetical protein
MKGLPLQRLAEALAWIVEAPDSPGVDDVAFLDARRKERGPSDPDLEYYVALAKRVAAAMAAPPAPSARVDAYLREWGA